VRTILQLQNFAKTGFFLTIPGETRRDVNFHIPWIAEKENLFKNLKLELIPGVQELMVFLTMKIPQNVENFTSVTKVRPTKCLASRLWCLTLPSGLASVLKKSQQRVVFAILVTQLLVSKQSKGSLVPAKKPLDRKDCCKLIQYFLIPQIVSIFLLVSSERIPTNLDVPKAKFLTQSVSLAKNQKMYPNVDVGMIVAKNQIALELVMQIVLALRNNSMMFQAKISS
jgi:hypothetical protein